MDDTQANKSHRAKKAGGKVNKKKNKEKTKSGKNSKAFSFSGGRLSSLRKTQRNAEIEEKRGKFIRVVDKTPLDLAPPFIVAVQGPPGVGKTTLIKSLVKHCTGISISEVNGPVTVVASRARRLTFLEVGTDMASMLDAAKIADLAILMIDASFGFEMDTFEFINIMQVSGFPRVMGVLTHLDSFKENKQLKKMKKRMKNRFWAETYEGNKLFYLTRIGKNGKYGKREVRNLNAFISVQKFTPLVWQSQHPYMLPLNIEVEPNSETSDIRTVSFSGYLKGARLRPGTTMHVPGAGDFQISSVAVAEDPCPAAKQTSQKDAGKLLRTLKTKERSLYAPGCDLGGVEISGTEMYIHLPNHKVGFTPEDQLIADEIKQPRYLPSAKMIARMKAETEAKQEIKPEVDADENDEIDSLFDSDEDENNNNKYNNNNSSDSEESTEGSESEDDESDEDENQNSEDESDEETPKPEQKTEIRKENILPEAVRMVRELQTASGALESAVNRSGELPLFSSTALRRLAPERVVGEKNETAEEEEKMERRKYFSEAVGSDDDWDDDDDNKEEISELFSEYYQDKKQLGLLNEHDSETDEELNKIKIKTRDRKIKDEESDFENEIEDINSIPINKMTARQLTLFVYGGVKSSVQVQKKNKMNRNLFDDEDDQIENVSPLLGNMRHLTESGWDTTDSTKSNDSEFHNSTLKDSSVIFNSITEMLKSCSAKLTSVFRLAAIDTAASAGWNLWTSFTVQVLKKTRFITGHWDSGAPLATGPDSESQKQFEKSGTILSQIEKDQPSEDEGDEIEKGGVFRKMKEEEEKRKAALAEVQDFDDSGFSIGRYLRITVEKVPSSWVDTNIDYVKLANNRKKIIICGGVVAGEESEVYLHARIKKHRWCPRVLKSNDVLTFSLGWRRFQSLPIYSIDDRNNVRLRFLKYTPEHLHCLATLRGVSCPANTGILAVRNMDDKVAGYRISATGLILENQTSPSIMKKLKLVGEPVKIFKNTVFVKNMFNSDLEVAKCLGARIQTVSGNRGAIKKPTGTDGQFRATFEHKVLMSDLILLKAWAKVQIKDFVNHMVDVPEWRRLRTQAEIRRELNIPVLQNSRSDYGAKPVRETRKFNELKVPKKIMQNLPISELPIPTENQKSLEEAKIKTLAAPIPSAYDKFIEPLLQKLKKIKEDKIVYQTDRLLNSENKKKIAEDRINQKKRQAGKEKRKAAMVKMGKREMRERKRQRMD